MRVTRNAVIDTMSTPWLLLAPALTTCLCAALLFVGSVHHFQSTQGFAPSDFFHSGQLCQCLLAGPRLARFPQINGLVGCANKLAVVGSGQLQSGAASLDPSRRETRIFSKRFRHGRCRCAFEFS